MEAPSPSYILSRALFVIAAIVAVLYGMSYLKTHQRRAAITAELRSITSDSSFFQQFYAADAEKSLVRAVALMAEANQIGIDPDTAIDRGLGIKKKYFAMDGDRDEPPTKDKIIRHSLRSNFENFRKLGYTPDFHTLDSMKKGELPPIAAGPLSGTRPEVGTIIDPALSPGMERVIANLEIRPRREEKLPPSDVEIAAAKRLANDLADAGIIEESAKKRILEKLSPAPKAEE